jgi:hypothetical protein
LCLRAGTAFGSTYNPAMLRRFALLLALVSCAAQAQVAAPVQDSPPLEGRKNQKVERLHSEDSAVSIDEVRYAGQTESITVQPKDGLPAYEIRPPSPARQRVDDGRRAGGGSGDRVWNLFSF